MKKLSLYPEERLDSLVKKLETDIIVPEQHYQHVTLDEYESAQDWKARLRMLKAFPTPTFDDIPLLETALNEEKIPLRREAVVLLGMIEDPKILPYIYQGLHDKKSSCKKNCWRLP